MRQTAILALLGAFAALAFAPRVFAQRSAGSARHPSGSSRAGIFFSGWDRSSPHARYDVYDSLLYPYGLPVDNPYLDDFSQPTPFLMQTPAVFSPPLKTGAEPLLIELRGDRYVRVVSQDAAGAREVTDQPAGEIIDAQQSQTLSTAANSRARSTNTAKSQRQSAIPTNSLNLPSNPSRQLSASSQLAPAVLIFRDGHSEEIRDYSIISGVIYARGNLYTDGFWAKQISLASLNLPATFASNQSRGVRFVLPSSANEVVTRP